MSDRAKRRRPLHTRHGVALLLSLITLVVVAACVLTLAQTRSGTLRSDRLRTSASLRARQADSTLALAVAAMDSARWRAVAQPAQSIVVAARRTRDGAREASVTRLGWHTVLVRGLATGRSGVPFVSARADHRLLVPLRTPIAMPSAALTGGQPWRVNPMAVVDFAPRTRAELDCRAGLVPDSVHTDTTHTPLDTAAVVLLDPDTVSAPMKGVFRLIRDRISRPMVVEGMVESVTGLLLGADLQLAGVLVVQGSVQPAGGRLDVTGAVITRDSGGGRSVLGSGDRVRYDACAIRRAMERVTRPAPAAAWTIVGRF